MIGKLTTCLLLVLILVSISGCEMPAPAAVVPPVEVDREPLANLLSKEMNELRQRDSDIDVRISELLSKLDELGSRIEELKASSQQGIVEPLLLPPKDQRPPIALHTNCPPCAVEPYKALRDAGLEVRYYENMPRWYDKAQYGEFDIVLIYKTLGGRWHWVWGWSNLSSFLVRYSDDIRNDPPKVAEQLQQSNHGLYYHGQPGWTWPGDLRQHLIQVHGVSSQSVRSWTDSQCIAYHSALHNGNRRASTRKPKQRRVYTQAITCPTCPRG